MFLVDDLAGSVTIRNRNHEATKIMTNAHGRRVAERNSRYEYSGSTTNTASSAKESGTQNAAPKGGVLKS
ncbi:hypothetical protein BG36_21625 [Aquamicrobium defluvii]|uniref:Uncharacterized protein n=1 Tax=Aquamicrobium defluvii TaxID=69279 RepID=A0A011TDJ1_9HYPH|nr:hypothetical protein BG36_21625 [Aquamicrobium defluvii]